MSSQRSGEWTDEPESEPTRFLGVSPAAKAVRSAIERAAQVDAPVLILGESGVGKELVAREIHAASARSGGPFVPINCAAVPESLIENELFGHEPGAYTDARSRRPGAFELAEGGSLFLDEVAELSPTAQPKLLRVLESGEITPLGAGRPRSVNFRLLAATNKDLRALCRRGGFREDLYYRLNVLVIRIPPLRERMEDVPLLADHFARTLARRHRRPYRGLSRDAESMLMEYTWPGNVRELRSVIERAIAFSSGMVLDASAFQLDPVSSTSLDLRAALKRDWRSARERFERAYVVRLMDQHRWNVKEAARAAKLAPRSLYKILRRLGIRPGPEDR